MLTKKTLSIFLEIIFLVIGLWISAYQDTKAGDEIYCFLKSGNCVSNYEPCILCGSYTNTCTVNASNNNIDEDTFSQLSSCATGGNKCQTGACPSSNASLTNGDPCQVRKYIGGAGVMVDNGLWDLSDTKCVDCTLNNVELVTCGDASGIYLTEMPLGSGNWQCSFAGDGKFESACGADAACDGQVKDYACASGKKCDTNGKCVAEATCNTNPTVAISPTTASTSAGTIITYTVTVTNNDVASCAAATFSLSQSGCPGGWICVLGATSLASISPGGNKSTFLTIESPAATTSGSNAVVTVTATGSASNSGTATATYSVENCPTNFSASFTKDCYTTAENIFINAKVGFTASSDTWGCGALYEPTAYTTNRWNYTFQNTSNIMPKTWNNFDTSFKVGGYAKGVWRFTLNEGTTCKGNDGCMDTAEVYACCLNADCVAPQTCSPATHTCSAASACTAPDCNGSTQYCSGGSWVNCPEGQTCSAGVCAAAPTPGCTSNGCGGGCPANCTGTDDPDCAGACLDATCATDTDCVVPPPAASCSGPGMYRSPLMFGYCTIPEIIAAATKWILGLVSAIIILILIFGGITYVTSAGDEERIKTAKNTILYAIVGLAIILLAYTMINEVKDILKIVP